MNTRGILAPPTALAQIDMRPVLPAATLAPFIEAAFVARWQKLPQVSLALLPCPTAYWVLGARLPGVHGVTTERRAVELGGDGWAMAIRFRPAGLRAFYRGSLVALRNRIVPVEEVLGGEAGALVRELVRGDEADLARLLDFLERQAPELTEAARLVNTAVDRVRTQPDLLRVEELSDAVGVSTRVLEQRFRAELGMSPKTVLRRCRAIELSNVLAQSDAPDWAQFAADWGFADQSHLIREFKAQVGVTPSRYAAQCDEGRAEPT